MRKLCWNTTDGVIPRTTNVSHNHQAPSRRVPFLVYICCECVRFGSYRQTTYVRQPRDAFPAVVRQCLDHRTGCGRSGSHLIHNIYIYIYAVKHTRYSMLLSAYICVEHIFYHYIYARLCCDARREETFFKKLNLLPPPSALTISDSARTVETNSHIYTYSCKHTHTHTR